MKLVDVLPMEDEYGNQYVSRDYSQKANQEYVHELARSMAMKGVPDEPISVVKDGGKWRIKTGNTRVMAMRELGTKECPAIYDPDDTVQSVIEATVRTDTKKKYEAVEQSRFIQQLAMFGDEEYVAQVASIDKKVARKVIKARPVVDDAGDDMSIERLCAIADYMDDPEAVKRLTDCSEKDFKNIKWDLDYKKEQRKKAAETRERLEGLGVQIVDGVEGEYTYYRTYYGPDDVPESLPDGSVAEFQDASRSYRVLVPGKSAVDKEAEERQRKRDERNAAFEEGKARREEWFVAVMRKWGPGSMPRAMCKAVESQKRRTSGIPYTAGLFIKENKLGKLPAGPYEVVAWFIANNVSPYSWKGLNAQTTSDHVKFMDTIAKDGYDDLMESELEILGECRDFEEVQDDE